MSTSRAYSTRCSRRWRPIRVTSRAGRRRVSRSRSLAAVPPGSPIPAYLRRLLLNGDAAGQVLFRQLFDAGVVMIEQLTAAGSMRGSADVAVRAAFLTVNDLAIVLSRDRAHGGAGS